jgi:aspartate/glutamate racemase/prolyl-tRNA editing enzyme YbaK/EbsC (Cys-tRNA(Pro) deacylase)
MSFPSAVAANQTYLESLGLWHLVSRNDSAGNCEDAANKRNRLGNKGIPLSDELKSHVGVYEHPDGRRYLVAHCRGHQQRDDKKLGAVLGFTVERLKEEELTSVFGLKHGLVNPFYFARQPNVTQLFDETVLRRYFTPHTMMTNFGDAEYGVEFDPRELVAALPRCTVADIVTVKSRRAPVEHSFGILTGNGPESGLELWKRINDRIHTYPRLRFRGDTRFPRVVVQSIPDMGLSMELAAREKEVRDTVLCGVDLLCVGGASVIGLACNTTQYFSDAVREVCRRHGAQFVSMVDETATVLNREGIGRFDLLGIGAVSDLRRWSDFRRIADRFTIEVPKEADIKRITDLALEVKQSSKPSGRAVSALGRLIDQATVTDTVLLALTELSLVVAKEPKLQERSSKRFIDTLSILANRMADIYLEERLAFDRPARSSTDGEPSEVVALTDSEVKPAINVDGDGASEKRRRLFKRELTGVPIRGDE